MNDYKKHFANNCIVASHRMERPHIGSDSKQCPFCLEHKDSLENIINEVWQGHELWVRIVANKYPIIQSEQKDKSYHDVIIDTGNHNENPKDFSVSHWKILLITLQQRWHQMSTYEDIKFIQIFKNYGTLAGASILHSHWQIVALKDIPNGMIRQYKQYRDIHKKCFLCDRSHLEETQLIEQTLLWEIIVPPEMSMPYEIWFVPKRHHQHYGTLDEAELQELAVWMKKILVIYEKIQPGCAYNICFMSGDLREKWDYHFHIKLMMRREYIAGFELATNCSICHQMSSQCALEIKKLLKE